MLNPLHNEQKNGFEQFVINYCNEKLQQLFIELTLKSEQEEYAREGIDWADIKYFNNKPICELIESKKQGIIALLDEECVRPGDVSDLTFLSKLNSTIMSHPHFDSRVKNPRDKQLTHETFRLKHYAGDVYYDVDGFIDKNNDALFKDLLYALNASSKGAVREMFPERREEDVKKMKRPESLGSQFRSSMNALIDNLMSKNPHYIRCLKPNAEKRANAFDDELVLHQCRYLGLQENIRVRRAGYCFRQKFEKFFDRFKMLCKETWPNPPPTREGEVQTVRDHIKKILDSQGIKPEEYAFGKTKIFVRQPLT
ncbi:Unconventional myosin-Ib, partial [Quaeritorhiza haematococci]